MMAELSGPIDELHVMCLHVREQIRDRVHDLRLQAWLWEPRPMPEGWQR